MMLKIAALAAIAATFSGAALAQAQTRGDETAIRSYEAIVPYHRSGVGQEDVGSKVMGLEVPNGFREPAAPNGRPGSY